MPDCPSGKNSYPSPQKAHRALELMGRSKMRSVNAFRADWHSGKAGAYQCSYCGMWHIGHGVHNRSTKRGDK